MIWMTWRQQRKAAIVGSLVLVIVAAALLVLGVTARSSTKHADLPSCLSSAAGCGAALTHLQHRYQWLPPVAASLMALPLLAGMFWGAPLVASEIETGTYRMAWSQSVSRRHWISTKLALVLGATAITTLGLSLLAVWAFDPLIPVVGNRFRGGWFDVQGTVPAAYALFALALGTCAGAVLRRTLPAMATTLVGFAVVRIFFHNLRRDFFTPSVKTVSTFIGDKPVGFRPGDWILSQSPTGVPTSGPPTNGPPASIFHYLPAARFWHLQGVETSAFMLLAAALVSVCVTVVVRSRPH
jgi:hypothetical protein